MSYKSILESNNADLQTLINEVNAIPDPVNIDAELETQDDLLAQLENILDNKAACSGGATLDDIGVFTFDALENAEFSFLKGMTFGEYINSKMNVKNNNYVMVYDGYCYFQSGSWTTDGISTDGTSSTAVTLDTIIEERDYLGYATAILPF